MKQKAGLIGNGVWGSRIKRELEHLGFEVFTWDPNPDRSSTTNLQELIDRVPVIFIASPSDWHCNYSEYALKAGKHVYCAKPLCFTWEHATALSKLAQEKELVLDGGFVFRHTTAGRRLLQDFHPKGLPPEFLMMNFDNVKPPRKDSNVILNLMIHCFDLMVLTLGNLSGSMYCRYEETEGHFQLLLNPTLLIIRVSCSSAVKSRWVVSGRREIQFYNFDDEPQNPLRKSICDFLFRIDSHNYTPEELRSILFCELAMRAAQGREAIVYPLM